MLCKHPHPRDARGSRPRPDTLREVTSLNRYRLVDVEETDPVHHAIDVDVIWSHVLFSLNVSACPSYSRISPVSFPVGTHISRQ